MYFTLMVHIDQFVLTFTYTFIIIYMKIVYNKRLALELTNQK